MLLVVRGSLETLERFCIEVNIAHVISSFHMTFIVLVFSHGHRHFQDLFYSLWESQDAYVRHGALGANRSLGASCTINVVLSKQMTMLWRHVVREDNAILTATQSARQS